MLAILGALSLIVSGYLVTHAVIQFLVKCLYKAAFQAAVDDRPLALGMVLREVDSHNAWIGLLWKQPFAALVSSCAAAVSMRMHLGLSLSLGVATVTFLVLAVALPAVRTAAKKSATQPKPLPQQFI